MPRAGLDLVLAGAQARLGPILITALGTAAFALPFIALGDVAGLEVMRPMAVFVLGGLVSSTLVAPLHPPEHLSPVRAQAGVGDRDPA